MSRRSASWHRAVTPPERLTDQIPNCDPRLGARTTGPAIVKRAVAALVGGPTVRVGPGAFGVSGAYGEPERGPIHQTHSPLGVTSAQIPALVKSTLGSSHTSSSRHGVH